MAFTFPISFLLSFIILFFPFHSYGIGGFSYIPNNLIVLTILITSTLMLLKKINTCPPYETIKLHFIILTSAFAISQLTYGFSSYLYSISLFVGLLLILKIFKQSKIGILYSLLVGILTHVAFATFNNIDLLSNGVTRTLRPTSGFLQVNIFAVTCVTGFAISVYLYTHALSERLKILPALFLILFPFPLLLTMSRSAILSTIIALLILSTERSFRKSFFKIMFYTLLGATIFLSVNHNNNSIPINKIEEFTHDPARKIIYSHSIWLISQKPITGYKNEEFRKIFFHTYQEKNDNIEYIEWIEKLTHPHNEILYIFFRLGATSLIPLFLLLKIINREIPKIKKSKIIYGTATLSPIFIHSMLEFPLHSMSISSIITCALIYVFFTKPGEGEIKKTGALNLLTISSAIFLTLIGFKILLASLKISSLEEINTNKNLLPYSISSISETITTSNLIFTLNADKSMENKRKLVDNMIKHIEEQPSKNIAYLIIELCREVACDKDKVKKITSTYRLSAGPNT